MAFVVIGFGSRISPSNHPGLEGDNLSGADHRKPGRSVSDNLFPRRSQIDQLLGRGGSGRVS